MSSRVSVTPEEYAQYLRAELERAGISLNDNDLKVVYVPLADRSGHRDIAVPSDAPVLLCDWIHHQELAQADAVVSQRIFSVPPFAELGWWPGEKA